MSSLEHPFSYAELPNDVGRLIFECLGEMGIVSCALVSKRVQPWVERIIYREIALGSKEKGALFYRTVTEAERATSSKSKGFLASTVKSLFIKWEVDAPIIGPIVKACSGVTSLALYIPDSHTSQELCEVMTSDLLHPTHLSVPGSSFPFELRNFLQPIFRNVTHLEMLWEDEDDLDLEWGTLRNLHQLTHISVDIQFHPKNDLVVDVAKNTLAWCPKSIQVCILWVIFESYFDEGNEEYPGIVALHKGEVDPRIVLGYSAVDPLETAEDIHLKVRDLGVLLFNPAIICGWSRPSKAEFTVWDHAEERIAQRLKPKEEWQNST